MCITSLNICFAPCPQAYLQSFSLNSRRLPQGLCSHVELTPFLIEFFLHVTSDICQRILWTFYLEKHLFAHLPSTNHAFCPISIRHLIHLTFGVFSLHQWNMFHEQRVFVYLCIIVTSESKQYMMYGKHSTKMFPVNRWWTEDVLEIFLYFGTKAYQ